MRTTPLLLAASLVLTAACGGRSAPVAPPQRLSDASFRYPEELWDAGVEGATTLKLFITQHGAVDTVRIQHTSGYPAFDSAAVAGARVLRFTPAHRGADSVGIWVLLPVQFDLPASDSAQGGAQ